MTSREDEALAQAAVAALTGQLALAPKPGLPDPRDLAARVTRRDHRGLRWSAKALAPGLAAMAAAARRTGEPTPRLRAELGAIGRCTEHSVGLAGGGHRGALWTLGLLVAAAALDTRARGVEVAATAKRIAAHPDRAAPRRPSRGATVSAKYGAAGCPRRGTRRIPARTTGPGRARCGPLGRCGRARGPSRRPAHRHVHPPGHRTPAHRGPAGTAPCPVRRPRHPGGGRHGDLAGRAALDDLDTDLHARAWSPRGSAGLLAGALFVDSLPVLALTRAA